MKQAYDPHTVHSTILQKVLYCVFAQFSVAFVHVNRTSYKIPADRNSTGAFLLLSLDAEFVNASPINPEYFSVHLNIFRVIAGVLK